MADDKIRSGFEEFHRRNPRVYALWDRFTRVLIAKGRAVGSAAMIAERIRWETDVETTGEPLKLNNNYRALYARRWMALNPEHAGFFRTRQRRNGTVNSTAYAA